MDEVAKTSLPAGYTYEFSGLTRTEQESSNSTAIVFVLCLTFVYLILSAQYESYILPLSVILSIPFGLAGAFIFTNMFGKNNDIYMQIALISPSASYPHDLTGYDYRSSAIAHAVGRRLQR